jgi:putative spermidine/putrescine transport system permease protein
MKPGFLPRGLTVLCVVFLVAPTVIVVVSSFTAGQTIIFPPQGFSISAYSHLVTEHDIRKPVLDSLIIGLASVVIGVVCGIPATLALYKYRIRGYSVVNAFLALGFSTPLIASAIGFLLLFTHLHLLNHLATVGFAVAIVNLPFMLWAMAGAIAAHNPELEEAAATLGAEEVQQFLFVTIPSIASGVILGAFLMFVFGITEFLVSFILVNVDDITLPVFMFGSLRQSLSPALAAVGALYVLFAMVICLLGLRFGRIEKFLFRSHQ